MSEADEHFSKALACLEASRRLRTVAGTAAVRDLAREYLERAERAAGPEKAKELRRRFELVGKR